MSAIFGEEYYQSVNYFDYLERSDKYDRTADELMAHLKTHNLDKGPILDFGCAVGLLLDSLKKLGYEDTYGVDISEWALDQCRQKGHTTDSKIHYDSIHGVTFALDVLEHIPEKEMCNILSRLNTRVLVFRMPIRREEDDNFYLECSRKDPTHVICWTKKQWRDLFLKLGYTPIDLNLHTLYTSVGVYAGMAINDEYVGIEF